MGMSGVKLRTIYAHVFPDKSVYIGQTSQENLNRRWNCGHGYRNQPRVHDAIMFYGWSNIEHEVLKRAEMTKEECNELECYITMQYVCAGYKVLNKYNAENPCRYRRKKYHYADEEGNTYKTMQEIADNFGVTKQAVSFAITNGRPVGGVYFTKIWED